MTVKRYLHPRLGEITIRRGKLSRQIKLSVHPVNGISISVPWILSMTRALKFIDDKEEWILQMQRKQEKKRAEESVRLSPGIGIKLIAGEIIFYSESEFQKLGLDATIIQALKKEAKKYLPDRTMDFAQRLGFNPGKITVRNNRSNWGSCSRSGNISLNIHLMRLSAELADFIIIHELCHLRHRDHGPQFHQLLNSLCGGKEREFNRLLRKERPQVLFIWE